MPREQINYPARIADDIDSKPSDGGVPVYARRGTGGCTAPSLHVGWQMDSWVQIHFEADRQYFEFIAENPDASDPDRTTGYTPVLSRDEINKLIKVLRRARDQAYGRDE